MDVLEDASGYSRVVKEAEVCPVPSILDLFRIATYGLRHLWSWIYNAVTIMLFVLCAGCCVKGPHFQWTSRDCGCNSAM
jgi:hypothetical protein